MIESSEEIAAPQGVIDAFVCRPEEGGPHPLVVLYMDAPGIREELRDMARRLATAGYAVMLPNLYWREGREGSYGFDLARLRTDPAEFAAMWRLMQSLSNAMVVEDTAALLAHARAMPGVSSMPAGCVGYCMSGAFVVAVAAAFPEVFAAAASYYGVSIVTDAPDSPHLRLADVRGELYLAFADTDPYVPDAIVDRLTGLIEAAGANGRVERYPGTGHGFAFPQRTDYRKAAAERHWERMLDLFGRRLRHA